MLNLQFTLCCFMGLLNQDLIHSCCQNLKVKTEPFQQGLGLSVGFNYFFIATKQVKNDDG